MAKKILLGLTTITPGEWRKKVKEIDELGIKEIALFLTLLNNAERQELYRLLETTKLEKIPHVHLRSDMKEFGLDYLVAKYRTEVFNVHSENNHFPFLHNYQKYNKKIFVENAGGLPTENDFKKYAGLCLDLSHWESGILSDGYESQFNVSMLELVKKHKIGVNHISAVEAQPHTRKHKLANSNPLVYDSHWLNDLSELDYVKKYKDYLADIISIELENPLKRQLEVKQYLEKILEL